MTTFQYLLLGRLQQDCEYYLGAGARNKKHLWALDEALQIQKMKELYESLPVKPEWLTLGAIKEYEEKMLNPIVSRPDRLSLSDLYAKWDRLADVAVEEDGSIASSFLHFGAGTPREEIWRWFEAQNSRFSVGEVQSGIRHEVDPLPGHGHVVYETGSDDTFWNARVLSQGERFSVLVYDADGDRRPELEGSFADQASAASFADKSVLRVSARQGFEADQLDSDCESAQATPRPRSTSA